LYDYTESYIQIEALKLEIEDIEDIYLIEEIHELQPNKEVDSIIEKYWLHGNRLNEKMRQILINFYILSYIDYFMEE